MNASDERASITSPLGSERHDPNHAPRPKEVEIYFWEPTGWGESSMGHVSSRIGNRMYSWGPGGMTVEPVDKYMRRNAFRSAVGRKMNFTPDESRMFEEYLNVYAKGHAYGVVDANCGDPAEKALELMGYPMFLDPFPADLRQDIDQLKLAEPGGRTSYPADPRRRKSGMLARAPWTELFK